MPADPLRPALDPEALRRALLPPTGPVARLDVVRETGSTNSDVAAAAADGAPDRTVLVAEYQSGGRGRAGRGWHAPARSGLFLSLLLRPHGVGPARWGWLPLLAGVAVCDVLDRFGAGEVALKWPNDVLLGPRQGKVAGILSQAVGQQAVVLGLGCNVGMRADERPVPAATSLHLEGCACTDRQRLLVALLHELDARERAWAAAGGDPAASGLAGDYRRRCATLGRQVRVILPGREALTGTAVDVDEQGRLVVHSAGQRHPLAMGEVVHLR